MGYRERIETAVKEMFNRDRKFDKHLDSIFPHPAIIEAIDYPGFCDVALDMLGIPEDNTLDYDLNELGYQPDECFCRDGYLDAWLQKDQCATADDFIAICYQSLKEFAENNQVFAKPKQRRSKNEPTK